MFNLRDQKTDSWMDRYRIAKTPRMRAPHNIESWRKIEKHMATRSSGTFDALAMVCSKHNHPGGGDGFVRYCIDNGWLKKLET